MEIISIGLTGGIASGKSTACKLIAGLGVPTIDADQVSREIVEPGSPGLEEVVRRFGSDILAEDGSLDRKKLGSRVMTNPEERRALEGIMHPRIRHGIAQKIIALEDEGHPAVIVEAALLVETNGYLLHRGLILVTCEPETQISRLMSRENFSRQAAQKWIASQLSLQEKEAVTSSVKHHWIIRNDGNREDLKMTVEEGWPGFIGGFER